MPHLNLINLGDLRLMNMHQINKRHVLTIVWYTNSFNEYKLLVGW